MESSSRGGDLCLPLVGRQLRCIHGAAVRRSSFEVLWMDRAVLSALVLVAAFIRLLFLTKNGFLVDSDEAIVGLMAKHMLEGAEIPTFYYGQHYMGSLEALLVVVSYWLGDIGAAALKAVPLIFSLMLVPLTYLLCWRVNSNVSAARIAALLTCIPPATLVEWSTKARGGFIEIVFIGVCALLLTERWSTTGTLRGMFIIGSVLGFGWWVNNQIIFVMLAVGAIVCLRLPFRQWFVNLICGVSGFVIGGAPYWIYNLRHDFVSFKMLNGSADVLDNLWGLLFSALPIIAGARRSWHVQDVFWGASLVAFCIYLFVFYRVVQRPELRRSVAAQLCLFSVFACLSVFSLSSFGSLSAAPRYLLPIYPVLFALVGAALGSQRCLSNSSVFLGLVILHLCSNYWGGIYLAGTPFTGNGERVARDHAELINWLRDRKVSYVRTNYWIGYRLAFETREKVKPLLVGQPFQVRIPEYEQAGQRLPERAVPYVLTPELGAEFASNFEKMGVQFARVQLSGYTVLYDVEQPVLSKALTVKDFTVSSTHNVNQLYAAFDGDATTRWGSGAPQSSHMRVALTFNEPRMLRAIVYKVGAWTTDWARELSIECLRDTGESKELSTKDQYRFLRQYTEGDLKISFPPSDCSAIVLIQQGSDTYFDWSIAELQVYPEGQ